MESTTLAPTESPDSASAALRALLLPSAIRTSDLTRRKSGGIPPRTTDYQGWFRLSGAEPVLLFRSPAEPGIWLTREQRDDLIDSLIARGVPFMSPRRGYALVEKGYEGQIAFLKRRRGVRREKVQFRNGQWVPYVFQPSMSD